MCKTCRKKARRKKRGSVSGFDLSAIDLQQAAGITGGAIAAKMINKPARQYLGQYLEAPGNRGKIARGTLAGAKVIGGLLLNIKSDNELLQDAGIGMAAIGGVELFEILAPGVALPSINGVYEDYEMGNVLEIDTNELQGTRNRMRRLDNYQEVASTFDVEELELAGAYN